MIKLYKREQIRGEMEEIIIEPGACLIPLL